LKAAGLWDRSFGKLPHGFTQHLRIGDAVTTGEAVLFGLDDRGEIVLKETGEETEEIIAKECYPELEAVFAVPGTDLRLRYQFGSG
jgi:hypothetical protein